MQCVILAGGLGTRMQPLTNFYPKALIEVEGLPFVHHQLSWLSAHGVTKAVLCIGYRGEMIRDYVGDGRRWDLHVRYVDEGKELRGTAGALRLALDKAQLDESFLFTYGDSFLPIDFAAVYAHFQRCGQPALMTVFHNEGMWDKSNVIFDQTSGQVTLYDKDRKSRPPTDFDFIDYGLSALRRDVVEDFVGAASPPLRADMAQVFTRLSASGLLAGLEVTQRFYEIGSFSGLEALADFLRGREQLSDRDDRRSH